jgi:ketosteroid isomerase-like protein
VEISPVGEVDSREKAIGFYKLQPPNGSMKTISATDEFSVRFYGDFAAIIAQITFSQTGNEAPSRPSVSFRATYVCRKEKGKWKISSAQVTGIKPPRPPQTK